MFTESLRDKPRTGSAVSEWATSAKCIASLGLGKAGVIVGFSLRSL